MKKLLLLLIGASTIGCGALENLEVSSSVVYQSGPCASGIYQYGVYGWGFYDCFGSYIGTGYYSFPQPRIIIRRAPKRVVKSRTSRGSNVNTNNNTRNNGRSTGVGRSTGRRN